MSTITYKHKDRVLHTTELSTVEDFQKIAEDILTTRKYPLAVRSNVSNQLLDETAEFDVDSDVVEQLEKVAGHGTGTSDRVYDLLRNRALLLYKEDRGLSDKLQKTAEAIKNTYEYIIPHDILEKTANFVDLVDRATGLHNHYDNGVNRPENEVFRYTVSDNQRIKKYAVHLQNDTTVAGEDIQNNFDNIKGVLKDAFDIEVNNIKEAAEQLKSLNSKQADLVIKTAL